QSFLERRRRQDLRQSRTRALQAFDLLLVQRDQRQVGGRTATGPRLCRVRDQSLQCGEPVVRQLTDLLVRQDRRRPGPGGRQPRAVRTVLHQAVELQGVAERLRRVEAAAAGGDRTVATGKGTAAGYP